MILKPAPRHNNSEGNVFVTYSLHVLFLQYYRAVIHAVASNGQTCVVTFPDYGNSEEVMMSDIRAVPKQAWVSQV